MNVNIDMTLLVTFGIFFIVVSFLLGWYINNKIARNSIAQAEREVKRMLADAEREANNLKKEKLLEVKDEWLKRKQELDNDINQKRQKLQNLEKQLNLREEAIEKKSELIAKKEKELKTLEQEVLEKASYVEAKKQEYEKLVEEEFQKLEQISALTRDEAKQILFDKLIEDAKAQAAVYIKEIRENAKIEAKKEAQKIIVQAIQRTAVDHSVETTVSVVQIQSDEMKGRIIGKEGRNIRAFESATGIDIIVDDTPEAVILSGFDQFRREVARIALERLIADGRIHPARIEEVVEKVKEELEEEILKEGENALQQLGLYNMNPELIRLIGKMKYRSSYGQNLLQHSIEVAYLSGLMAAEIGLDPTIAKRAGLLHDIGKTVDRNTEGPHALLGAEIAKKYKEHPIVVNAIASHHEDVEMEHPIAAIVQAADAISGARPGARREPLESYVKRLENLEQLAKSFEGVAKTYAIQAGREVRVVVEPEKVDDVLADKLANDIALKIQEEMEYPGQIKVTLIREVRKVAYAK
jgi:ribonuclease Y